MRKLQANEINMISGGKSEGDIVNDTLFFSIILGGVLGASSLGPLIDDEVPTEIKVLAELVGFIDGAIIGGIAHKLGSLNAKK